ncbi:MAG TPA: MFS transporter [Alphaproteobacteria bacterium]|nr:MFS transporter [Alphaproteobacteria bacterium]
MASSADKMIGLRRIAAALGQSNYRAFTIGNAVSLIGTWLQRVAVGWLAWQLTKSGTWLGLVAFADLFPTVVLSPLAGALADRFDRLRIVVVTQIIAMLQACGLAALVYADAMTIERLFALTVALGVANALNQPARLALIPSLVEREHLSSAVAINSIVFNSARFLGPAAAGFAIAHGGIGVAFLVNALTYVVFLVALALIRLTPMDLAPSRRGILGDTIDGYAYATRHPGIGPMLLLLAITSLCTRAFIELLPGFADAVFHRGAEGLAWLTAATGLGAMAGGLWMAQRPGIAGLTRLIVANVLLISAALIGFVATDHFLVAFVCLLVAGFSLVVNGIGAQTLVQHAAAPNMRGRVMATYGMIFRGGPAIGALVMGTLSSQVGLQLAVGAGAVLCALSWLWARRLRDSMAQALE